MGGFSGGSGRENSGNGKGNGIPGSRNNFKAKDHIKGLTTAASLWAVSAVGIGIGLGEYFLVAVSTILILLVLELNRIEFFREI